MTVKSGYRFRACDRAGSVTFDDDESGKPWPEASTPRDGRLRRDDGAFEVGLREAVAEQQRERGGEEERLAGVGFDEQVEVEDPGDGGDVGEAVEALPAL